MPPPEHPDTTTGGNVDDHVRVTADARSTTPDSDDLEAALTGLLRLSVGGQTLDASLTWVATLTVLAIPGGQGAGVAMLERDHPETVCVSHAFVREVDDIQYHLGEGPCITAAAENRTVVSGRLGSDPAWPRFSPRVRALDVQSVLSLPLVVAGGEVLGALNVYSHEPDAFDDRAAELGGVFATAAAVVVDTARELMQARRLAAQLQTALTSRATIDQAIGILMSRQGGTAEDAFATLRRLSQTRNIKLTSVASGLVDDAVRRARSRHAGP